MFKKLVLLTVLSLLLAACGGGGATAEISAEMTDLMFNPTNFEVPAGADVTLKLTNNGAVEHNFIILKQGVTVTSSADIKP